MARKIRLAGVLYLINIAGGIFAEAFVRSAMMVRGDPAATAANILSHESLYRWGFVAGIVIVVTNAPLALIFYELLKAVNRSVALLVAFFILLGTAIESVNLLNHFAPLILLGTVQSAIPPDQVQTLAYVALRLQSAGYSLSLVFFGFYGLLAGYLIFKSTFLPRVLGMLLIAGGSGYLINSFTGFLAPAYGRVLFPYVLFPAFVAELSVALWFLMRGVNLERWKAQAAAV